jgi:hypothetical protein
VQACMGGRSATNCTRRQGYTISATNYTRRLRHIIRPVLIAFITSKATSRSSFVTIDKARCNGSATH